MITIGMNYDVIPGKENIFENAFEGVANALSSAQGHEFSNLYRDCKIHNKYIIISQWEDQQAYQAFITSEAFRKVTNWGASEILSGRPMHQVY
jgi:heme-degrading monooxygenase HmoA